MDRDQMLRQLDETSRLLQHALADLQEIRRGIREWQEEDEMFLRPGVRCVADLRAAQRQERAELEERCVR